MKGIGVRELSRRDFLGASALGVVGLSLGARTRAGSSPHEQLLYIGTYTENGRTDGIFLVRLDTATGALRRVGAVDAGPNPSFLAIHPNGRWLYAVNELDDGGVSALAIDGATGTLSRIDDQRTHGGAPCYVSVDRSGRTVLVANYATGSVAVLPVGAAGGLGAASFVDQHHGTGPVADRQKGPHAHSILTDPSNRFALSADLGADRVFVYRLDGRRGTLQHVPSSDDVLPAGSGPRHIAFHPTLPLVYVVTELASTLVTLDFDRATGKLTVVDSRSTLPNGWSGTSYAADVHIAPNGSTLYTSNRGHDSIAAFALSRAGLPSLEQTISCGGDWPRNFSLDETGRWLVVANQRSNTISVLARDATTGRLSATTRRLEIPTPACVRPAGLPST